MPNVVKTPLDEEIIRVLLLSYAYSSSSPTINQGMVSSWDVERVAGSFKLAGGYGIQVFGKLDLIDGTERKWEITGTTIKITLEKLVKQKMNEASFNRVAGSSSTAPKAATRARPGRNLQVSIINIPTGIVAGRRTAAKAFGFSCVCENDVHEKTFACDHVTSWIASGNDVQHWAWRMQHGATTKPSDDEIEIGIPIFRNVMHRISLVYDEWPDWDGTPQRRVKVNPNAWFDRNYVRIYDADALDDLRVLSDQQLLLEEQIRSHPTALAIRDYVVAFLAGAGTSVAPLGCSQMKSHNYGTTKKLWDWLTEPRATDLPTQIDRQLEERTSALVFTLMTYNLCYICYRNSEPLFSVISI